MKSIFSPEYQQQNLESKIAASLERISEAFRVMLWNDAKEYSLSPIQLQILVFLYFHSHDKRSVTSLSQEYNMTKATISDAVNSLLEKNLITKKIDKTDSRKFTITLTKFGNKIVNDISNFAQPLVASINQFSKKEKENLNLFLMKIIYSLVTKNIINIQRMCFTCKYFKINSKQQKYCLLLQLPLGNKDLRVDCAEHFPSENINQQIFSL